MEVNQSLSRLSRPWNEALVTEVMGLSNRRNSFRWPNPAKTPSSDRRLLSFKPFDPSPKSSSDDNDENASYG